MAIDLSKKNELQWVKEGRVFYGIMGDLTTPVTLNNADLVRQTPDFMVRTPAGVVIVPLRVELVTEATGGTVFQSLISSCNNDPGVANVTAITPVNCNTRFANLGSAVTAYITATGNTGTAPAGVADHHRVYVQTDIDVINENAVFDQVMYAPFHGKGAPCIVGDDSHTEAFLVYMAQGTSGTGYILAQWAEFTYAEFYAA